MIVEDPIVELVDVCSQQEKRVIEITDQPEPKKKRITKIPKELKGTGGLSVMFGDKIIAQAPLGEDGNYELPIVKVAGLCDLGYFYQLDNGVIYKCFIPAVNLQEIDRFSVAFLPTGRLTGRVCLNDVPQKDVLIEIVNCTHCLKTDANGTFDIPSLTPGSYSILMTATIDGFVYRGVRYVKVEDMKCTMMNHNFITQADAGKTETNK